nr:hypothetical protein [Sutcliffiella horikoshii]
MKSSPNPLAINPPTIIANGTFGDVLEKMIRSDKPALSPRSLLKFSKAGITSFDERFPMV